MRTHARFQSTIRFATILAVSFGFAHTTIAAGPITPTLINGTPVPSGTWKEVVYISMGGGACSATLIGPRVLITAAHCGTTGTTATFTIDGKKYSAKLTRSSLYPARDHDISLGLVTEEVKGIEPKTVGGTATKGLEITLLGYGCTQSNNGNGAGGNDGILRIGKSVITSFQAYDMVSTTPGGAALCFGDSGGPAFQTSNGEEGALLLGINSKGNISTTNYNTRLDSTESQNFLKNYASANNVEICGINKDCQTSDPTDPPATCTLTANPQSLFLNESVTLTLASQNATSGEIDGVTVSVPNGQRSVTTSSLGKVVARARVDGPGGAGQCETSYTVNDRPSPGRPTCTLSATPQVAKAGETVTLELVTQGAADFASIDGVTVSVPSGKRMITTKLLGDFSANGFVRGTGGSSNCFAEYKVTDPGTPIPPSSPAYSIIPAACGSNALTSSGVKTVCIGVLKKAEPSENLKIQNALLITYNDGVKEVMPVLSTKSVAADEELWTLYANKSVANQNYQVMDSKTATVMKRASDGAYLSIEGRSATGRYYVVDSLGVQ